MSIEKIKSVLDLHSVPYYTEAGRIYADSMIGGTKLFERVEDLTDTTPESLYQWLGY